MGKVAFIEWEVSLES